MREELPVTYKHSELYWSLSPEDLLRSLRTSREGLTAQEAQDRLARVGSNALQTGRRAVPLRLFLSQFRSPILLILLFATLVSGVVGDWMDAAIILGIVLGSVLLSSAQEYRANAAVQRLRDRLKTRATVLRNGQPREIAAEEVVPGDVVLLAAGSLIPADGVVLESKDFYVSQAVLTGETFPVEKRAGPVANETRLIERTNCVFMGTSVRSGTARAVIVVTGRDTEFGEIARRLVLRPPETEFSRGIRRFGLLLSEVMLILVLIIFGINVYLNRPILDSLLFSVALGVGLTPQLLPAIISITLSKGAHRMANQGVLVRRLDSIENFGSIDVLCSDKTGTLTEGTVLLDNALDLNGQPSERVLRYAYLNASLQLGLPNPLDQAIVARPPRHLGAVTKVAEIPYDFVRKRLSVVVEEGGARTMVVKGALEAVLQVCAVVADGERHAPLSTEAQGRILERYAEWSSGGFRVLGVATRDVLIQSDYTRDDEHDLCFVGFLVFSDPLKPDAEGAIASLARDGVKLKIISGDNRLVATHVARAVGLSVGNVLTGATLAQMRDEALWQAVETTDVFAEMDPNQKERILLALKKRGHVVGFLGDGINDAPALHAADVGISVDSAADVAREAADFVLTERDLGMLHQGILLGRGTFANTLKYVFIVTSTNFGNMFSMAGASLFLPFLPMLPTQILLTNFLTDFPAMAIGGDRVDPELVAGPRRWDVGFIRRFMLTFGLLSSAFDYLTFGVLLLLLRTTPEQFRTSWFLLSVWTGLLILLVLRTRRAFYRSQPSRALLVLPAILAGLAVVLPWSPWSQALGFGPLSGPLVAALGGIVVLYVLASEVAKRAFYRRPGL